MTVSIQHPTDIQSPLNRHPNKTQVQDEADYSKLPILVLNLIFDHLSYKERVKCKAVCHSWRERIELVDAKRKTLVLHFGPYLLNLKWSYSDQTRHLMKYGNSFELRRPPSFSGDLSFLKHPLTRTTFKHIKKLCIYDYSECLPMNMKFSNPNEYLDFLDQCEEIEILNLQLPGNAVFELPKLRVLTIKSGALDRLLIRTRASVLSLVLRSPSLQVLVIGGELEKIDCAYPEQLKHIECHEWPARGFESNGKQLTGLQYLNLFNGAGSTANGELLKQMPNLKKLIFHSDNKATWESFQLQKQRFGLNDLTILNYGFVGPAAVYEWDKRISLTYHKVEHVFNNYSHLEAVPWKIHLDYTKLFDKFKILPSNFFERFSNISMVQIDEVTSMMHLFAFLRHCPCLDRLLLDFSLLKDANLVLEQMQLLSPSLRSLSIFTGTHSPNEVIDYDLSFFSLLKLTEVELRSFCLPIDFLRKLISKGGAHLQSTSGTC